MTVLPFSKQKLVDLGGETMHLGGGNSNIFSFSPRNFGEDEPILSIFFNLVVQPTTH